MKLLCLRNSLILGFLCLLFLFVLFLSMRDEDFVEQVRTQSVRIQPEARDGLAPAGNNSKSNTAGSGNSVKLRENLPVDVDYKAAAENVNLIAERFTATLKEREWLRTRYKARVDAPKGTVVLAVVSAPTEQEKSTGEAEALSLTENLDSYTRILATAKLEEIRNDYLVFEKKYRVIIFAAAADQGNKEDIYTDVRDTDDPSAININPDGTISGLQLDFSGLSRWPRDDLDPPPRYGHLFSLGDEEKGKEE